MNERKVIRDAQTLVDYIHHTTSEQEMIPVEPFLKKIHNKIVAASRAGEPVRDEVYIIYFKLAILLTGLQVSRHRLIATIDGISDWYISH
jgi:hypothetical protein